MGLSITSCGVIYLKDSEGDMRQAFDYVRDLGASIAFIGVSRDQRAAEPVLEEKYAEYALDIAGPPIPFEAHIALQAGALGVP